MNAVGCGRRAGPRTRSCAVGAVVVATLRSLYELLERSYRDSTSAPDLDARHSVGMDQLIHGRTTDPKPGAGFVNREQEGCLAISW